MSRETNRRNAAKSTGPKNTISTRFNAVKHGLLSDGVTELDSPETFPAICAKLEAELKPVGEIEYFLTRRIALGMVRLRRVILLEAEFLTAQLNPAITETTFCNVNQILAEMDADKTEVLDPGIPARLTADTVNSLTNTFQRYETAIENKLFRAMNQLERLQRLRHGEHIPAPASADVGIHSDKESLASFGNLPQLQEETAP